MSQELFLILDLVGLVSELEEEEDEKVYPRGSCPRLVVSELDEEEEEEERASRPDLFLLTVILN